MGQADRGEIRELRERLFGLSEGAVKPNLHLHRASRRLPDAKGRKSGRGGGDSALTNTIFYSWQSDLSETRNVIRAALDKAVRK